MTKRVMVLLLLAVIGRLAIADQIDDYLREQMAVHKVPGAALKVIRDGQDIKTAAYGLANLELNVPVTPESVFEIGSVTKQFTAACILLLQQDAKLSIEDKITKYLPGIPESWSNVTVRHLLSHTSGIKSYTGLDGFALTRHLTQAQFIKALSTQSMEFQPGDSWKYSNSGYSLLGYIVENVSGKGYWQFLRERLLQPVGMSATTERSPGVIITNRVSGYEQTNHIHINRDYDLTDVFSAGALASTVGDLAKWNAALDSDAILNARSKKVAWAVQRLNNGKVTKYGLGWFIDEVDGHHNIGHGGSTSGFSASIQRFPHDHLTIILLTNTDEQIATTLARKIATFYFSAKKGS